MTYNRIKYIYLAGAANTTGLQQGTNQQAAAAETNSAALLTQTPRPFSPARQATESSSAEQGRFMEGGQQPYDSTVRSDSASNGDESSNGAESANCIAHLSLDESLADQQQAKRMSSHSESLTKSAVFRDRAGDDVPGALSIMEDSQSQMSHQTAGNSSGNYKRNPNYSQSDKVILLNLVKERIKIIEPLNCLPSRCNQETKNTPSNPPSPPKKSGNTVPLRKLAWDEIFNQYNSHPSHIQSVHKRDLLTLKLCWKNLKAKAKKDFTQNLFLLGNACKSFEDAFKASIPSDSLMSRNHPISAQIVELIPSYFEKIYQRVVGCKSNKGILLSSSQIEADYLSNSVLNSNGSIVQQISSHSELGTNEDECDENPFQEKRTKLSLFTDRGFQRDEMDISCSEMIQKLKKREPVIQETSQQGQISLSPIGRQMAQNCDKNLFNTYLKTKIEESLKRSDYAAEVHRMRILEHKKRCAVLNLRIKKLKQCEFRPSK